MPNHSLAKREKAIIFPNKVWKQEEQLFMINDKIKMVYVDTGKFMD